MEDSFGKLLKQAKCADAACLQELDAAWASSPPWTAWTRWPRCLRVRSELYELGHSDVF